MVTVTLARQHNGGVNDQQEEHHAAAERSARFITEHAAEPITVADMADAAGYSAFHFTRLFAQRTHVTPNRFLAGIRFHRAKELLLTQEHSVVDICHEVGFSSPGTFTRRFREEVGVAPSELRRLADALSESTPSPYTLYPPGITEADLTAAVGSTDPMTVPAAGTGNPLTGQVGTVTGTVRLPPRLRDGPGLGTLVWIGFYPAASPAGLPVTGVLRQGEGAFRLPLLASAPWLLATAVPATAEPVEHLANPRPAVGIHPQPLTASATVQIGLDFAAPWQFPLFGWEFEDMGAEYGNYHMVTNGGASVGGAMSMQDNYPDEGSAWTIYLKSDDIEASLADTAAAGGNVMVPAMPMPGLGSMGLVTTPGGEAVGLWQSDGFEGFALNQAIGAPVWFEVMSFDYAADAEYYRSVWGWDLTPLGDDGQEAGQEGGTVVDGPMDTPFGRLATVADPAGASFQIAQVAAG